MEELPIASLYPKGGIRNSAHLFVSLSWNEERRKDNTDMTSCLRTE